MPRPTAPSLRPPPTSPRPTPERAPKASLSRWRAPLLLLAAALALGPTTACHLLLDGDPAAGIGAPCEEDTDCQASRCIDEVCASPCTTSDDCPAPATCTSAALCQLPLRVGFVHAGEPASEQWTQAHETGREDALLDLPYLVTEAAYGKLLAADAASAIDDLIARGFHLIVATSPTLRDVAALKALEHPETKFLTCDAAPPTTGNHVAYHGRMYQAAYLAGYAAARRSTTHRLGMLGSLPTPAVVRYINAFTTGARRASPDTTVEIRWLGFWHDTLPPDPQGRTQERVLTEALLASGCDVIAHQTDNGIPVTTVANAGTTAKAIGNNTEDACPPDAPSCLGTTFWRWGPLYTRLLDGVHRSRWPSASLVEPGMLLNPQSSTVNFALGPAFDAGELALEISALLEELSAENGEATPFIGPLCSTGQRDPGKDGTPDCLAAGEAPSAGELQTMCWFVEGLVEREDPDDPSSPDRPALVPSRGDCGP
ncbi:BMP family ABC transporter substrate-binding protein [Chondromyces apiculatus]|uniref:BMP family ABC transporter substrate-binding protein n=1 Tax=Chondromyces apiculatus TaxID=51 RepID=UPI0018CC398E|nr:BMP family ABC transporter substrate-binding protein [Chondromyces apiculatus]